MSGFRFPTLGVFTLLFMLVVSQPGAAHPHVWVAYHVDVVGTKDGITKLHFRWHFDATFTSTVQEAFHIKAITPKDVPTLRDKAFSNLHNYHYLIFAKLDGTDFEPKSVSNFGAEMKGKNLEYTFTVDLPHPTKALELSLYDPEFYIDIGPPIVGMSVDRPGTVTAEGLKPEPFVSVSAEKGAAPPTCDVPQGKTRISDTWGTFTVFVLTCRSFQHIGSGHLGQ
jgi:hypothetical protein